MAHSPDDLHKTDSRRGQDGRIEDLFDEASELAGQARAAFLDINCSQPSVRLEVERLLVHHDRLGLLDSRLLDLDSSEAAIIPSAPRFMEGVRIANRFRVLRLIGSGGMGEVYEAEDLEQHTRIALKTLRGEIACNVRFTSRFRRELRLARDVSHPNVCPVLDYWDIDQDDRRLVFFTMPLLCGETLAERIASEGPLHHRSAFRILQQAAEGIGEVHRRGIVHRDLKPSNIFLVRDADKTDRAIVMDFGLARTIQPGEFTETTTKSLMGTPRYMAPELFEGVHPTVAGDVYSFGVMAFEMVTGANYPLVAPRSVIASLPPEWDGLQQCFSRNPNERPASIAAVVSILSGKSRRWRKRLFVAAAIVIIGVAGTAGWIRLTSPPAQARTTAQLTFDKGFTSAPSSSLGGKLLVYASDRGASAGNLNIWMQSVETGATRQLTSGAFDENDPAISPDGTLIAYHLRRSSLMLKPVAGGPEREIAKWGDNPQFSPDGKQLAYWTGQFAERENGQVWLAPVSGDAPPRRIAEDFVDARFPSWSPDGKFILFRGTRDRNNPAYSILEWWTYEIGTARTRSIEVAHRFTSTKLVPHDSPALWDGSEVLFSGRAGQSTNLWSFSLPTWIGRSWASPIPLTNGAGLQDFPARLADGRIAFANWRERVHVWKLNSTSGELTEITSEDSKDTRPSSSRDGKFIAFARRLGDKRSVWIEDLSNGSKRELLNNEFVFPFISPDGKLVAVSSGTTIRLLDSHTAASTSVCGDCGELVGWIPDGSGLLYVASQPSGIKALQCIDLRSGRRSTLASRRGLRDAAISPDGRTIALTARDEEQGSRLFVARLLGGTVSSDWIPVTAEGAWVHKPTWSDDGRTVLFASTQDGFECIWAQSIDTPSLRPLGEVRAVRHFHRATFRLSHLPSAAQSLSHTRGSLYLSIDSAESNLWAVEPLDRPNH